MRLFIAIVPPLVIRERLALVRDALRACKCDVKWVEAENIHLTLRFLGNVSPARVEAISKELAVVAARHPAFRLRFEGCGVFPNRRHPRVVWMGVEGDLEALRALQNGVEQAVARLGFGSASRGFSAHVTLGRVRSEAGARDIAERLDALERGALATMSVDTVVLMESRLSSRGPTYHLVYNAMLGELAS